LLEKQAAAAVYHPDLLGKEEYALRAQASIPLRTKKPPDNQKSPAPPSLQERAELIRMGTRAK